jgi:hypothetical protein
MTIFPKSVKIPKCRGRYILSKLIPHIRHGEVGVYKKVEHDATRMRWCKRRHPPLVGVYKKVEHDATAPDLVYLSFYQASHFLV